MKNPVNPANKLSIYQSVTNRFVELLKIGVLPWAEAAKVQHLPANYTTKTPYKGINKLLLSLAGSFQTPYFITFLQAKQNSWKVKSGSKGNQVVMYGNVLIHKITKAKIKQDDFDKLSKSRQEDYNKIPFAKGYCVFNLDQVDGAQDVIKTFVSKNTSVPNRTAEVMISAWTKKPVVVESTLPSYGAYDINGDKITMPEMRTYIDRDLYYHELFRQWVKSTYHPDRLDKKASNPAFLEIVAEIGASFLCSMTGIHNKNVFHKSSFNVQTKIESLITKLEEDEKYIFRAAAAAQASVDHILSQLKKSNLTKGLQVSRPFAKAV